MGQTRGVILVSGATGFLGRRLCTHLARQGWTIRALARDPGAAPRAGVFRCALPGTIDEAAFDGGGQALVHAAAATRRPGEAEAEAVNIEGSRRLFGMARAHGIRRIVFVSSMSAAPDAPARYGRDKWRVEQMLEAGRDVAVRPGLVVGPGGLFARMRAGLARSRIAPLVYGGKQRLPVLWWQDLCLAVERVLDGAPLPVVRACAPEPVDLRKILEDLATLDGHRVVPVPLPGGALALLLALAERGGLRLPITSDNVISLRQPPSADTHGDLPRLGLEARGWPEMLELLRRGESP
jgi:NADH dehydrogenase